MVLKVISRPTSAVVKLSTIDKIHKYRGFQEGHHFIPMAMEMHSAPMHDRNCFLREYAGFSHDR
jgi:hypothetical protein